jgi:hypothetical protein
MLRVTMDRGFIVFFSNFGLGWGLTTLHCETMIEETTWEISIEGRIILMWILKKYSVGVLIGFIWFKI